MFTLEADALGALAGEWFAFGVHFIRGYVGTVRRVETHAREREALVALGTLAAGLAHELNNPASAAIRAVDSLSTTSARMYAALSRLAAEQMSPEQFAGLDALRQELQGRTPPADSMAEADLEDALGSWLADHDVAEEWLLAPPLAAAGADLEWCERLAEVVPGALLGPGVDWVASAQSMNGLLAEVKDSTGRDLRARRPGALVHPARPRLAAVDRHPRGPRQHRRHAAHKIGSGIVVERDYGPRCRGSRRWPPS